jgi:hypothetical protein
MQPYTDVLFSTAGPVRNVNVTVNNYPSGTAATIYSDNGVTVTTNPLLTGNDGRFLFYAADGFYTITVSGAGIQTATIGPILLQDYATTTPIASKLSASSGSALVGTIAAGSGAVARMVQAKLRDVVNVLDYAANGVSGAAVDSTGALDSYLGFQAAGSTATTVEVHVPAGTYKLSANPVPTGTVTWVFHGSVSFTGAGVLPGVVIAYGAATGDLSIRNNVSVANAAGYALQKSGICAGTEAGWTSNPATSNWVTHYPYIISNATRSGNAPTGIWASNPITEVAAANDVTAWAAEFNINNNASSVLDPNANLKKVGADSVSGGPNNATAAFRASGGHSDSTGIWNVGYYAERCAAVGFWARTPGGDTGNQFTTGAFWDNSNSAVSLIVNGGTHTYGADFNGGTFTGAAIRLPNNIVITSRNAAGNADVQALFVGNDNTVVLNGGGSVATKIGATVQPLSDNAQTMGANGTRWSAVWAANGTIQTSDPRLKTDIQDLPAALPIVWSITPKTYRWKVGGMEMVEVEEEQLLPVYEDISEEVTRTKLVDGKAIAYTEVVVNKRLIMDHHPVVDDQGKPVTIKQLVTNPTPEDGRGKYVEADVQLIHTEPRKALQKVTVKKPVEREGRRTHWGFLAPDVKSAMDKLNIDFGGYVKGEDGTENLRPDQLIPVLWKAVQELSAEFEAYKAAHP